MIKAKCFPDARAQTDAVVALLKEHFGRSEKIPHAVMLAGGTTPMAAYKLIAEQPFDVDEQLHMLFSDDRMALPESDKSNYGNTRPMLGALRIPEGRVLRVHAEYPTPDAARMYGKELGRFVDTGGRITLGFLGLGTDGHTASLFSKRDIDRGDDEWAIAVRRPDGLDGVSVTPHLLARVERIVFLVSGAEKREMARKLLKESLTIPAGMAVARNKSVELWTDPAAWPL